MALYKQGDSCHITLFHLICLITVFYLMLREEKLTSKKNLLPFFRISFSAGDRRSAAACECSRVQLEPLLHSGSWKRQLVFADGGKGGIAEKPQWCVVHRRVGPPSSPRQLSDRSSFFFIGLPYSSTQGRCHL